MGLGPLQGRHEGVGDWGLSGRIGALRGRQSLQRYAEAELEGPALKRVGGIRVGLDARLTEEPRGGGQEGGRHVERRRLAMVAAAGLRDGVVEDARRLRR